jgi:hypothetical protein
MTTSPDSETRRLGVSELKYRPALGILRCFVDPFGLENSPDVDPALATYADTDREIVVAPEEQNE